jgi:hypothetical protein
MKSNLTILSILFFFSIQIFAQPTQKLIQVIVTPDHADWTYNTGDKAVFTIQVLRNNYPLEGVEVSYKIQPELVEV